MLTKVAVRNFKRFDHAEVELGKTVVLIGPNNSGKTTALQALALWDVGLRRWLEKRSGKASPERRPGVTINRNDLIAIPIPSANLLWRDLHVREQERVNGKPITQNIRIDIVVEGVSEGKAWSCGLEFDYANEESFYCRPLRSEGEQQRTLIPAEASAIKLAYLPPMSGLSAVEPKWEPGRISVLLGEGQTAQVLRNLCYQLYDRPEPKTEWEELISHIDRLFGVEVLPPAYVKERGEITMSYKEKSGVELDLSSSGRGLQQTVLLLAYLFANPKTVLLLDEPDAHLEVLRQQQTYDLITDVADKSGSQIIAASHSEEILKQAADRDIVVAFVGRPHRIDDRGSQVLKALKDIGFDQYYQAEQTGWILYLEGSTDMAILKSFANTLGHEAAQILDKRPFLCSVGNQPQKARSHFFGLREAKSDLVGIAIFDKIEAPLQQNTPLVELMWNRRELENYLCSEEVLMSYARSQQADDLFGAAEAARREKAMRESIDELTKALRTLGKPNPWSPEIKATDEFLDRLFERYFERLGLPNMLRKTDYHILTKLVSKEMIDPEIKQKLDAIVAVAKLAKPRVD
jgi:hypothetical protein